MCYLAKCLAALTSLVDSSTPSGNNTFTPDMICRRESSCRHRPLHILLFNVAKGLACRVPLTKLVELDGNVRPYLAVLMVASLLRVHEMLTIPNILQLWLVSMEAFKYMLQVEAGKLYDNYGVISQSLLGAAAEGSPVEVEA